MNRATATEPAMETPSAIKVVGQLNDHERRRYSYRTALLRLVESQLAGDPGRRVDGLEAEVSNAIGQALGRTTGGLFLPTTLRTAQERMEQAQRVRAGLDTKTGAAGGYLVQSGVSADVIELLRAQLTLARMGARLMGGLSDTLAFPVQLTGTTAVWSAENPGSDIDLTASTYGQRVLIPKSLTATTAFSLKLLTQATPDTEAEVRRDLASAHALEIDKAGINGSGTVNEPVGVLKVSGIGNVACGSDGAIPSFQNAIDLETAIANANVDTTTGTCAYLSTPNMRAKLKTVAEASGSSNMVWRGNDTVNGRLALVSGNVPSTLVKGSSGAVCHAILFADWSEVVIGEWGVLEVLTDPFTFKKQNLVECTSYQLVDVAVRRPAALAAILDGKIS
ncbi:MAG TPA: phage major capsid protein [Terriglobia bacterium]|nr:phage major capsid protein [Terriglobia bacterium]